MSYIAKLILAHGAGAGMESDFMQSMQRLLEERGIETVLFDFEYMQKAKELGKKRPPDKAPKLIEAFEQQIEKHSAGVPLFIGGKSMGGRIATMLPNLELVKGIAVLGYPFHPPGKPEKLRIEHFAEVAVDLLILQGERDTFGNKEEVSCYSLPSNIAVEYLSDGDHSFKPRKASGLIQKDNLVEAADKVLVFIKTHL